jgi:two-component system, NtrC family, sensor kinase
MSSAQAASVQPILDTVVTNAGRLCCALNATIYLCEGDSVVIHAQYGPSGLSPVGTRRPINRDWVTGAALLDGRTIQVPDLVNSNDYPAGRELARRLGDRTTLAVPLMRDTTAIGVILATRREVHPFGDKRHLTIAAARAAFRPPTSPLRPILPRF